MVIPGSKKHFCEKLAQIGVWEGVDCADQVTTGPIVQCIECGKKFRIMQETWDRIPAGKKMVRIKQKEKEPLFKFE
jgi:hypothetical protein